ncbi:Class II abasic (AP) endonuclease [Linnemannia schmuckeri]|uniref:DNA-(apurinic or apyrimidinic site) endonuclease n=1 Tax=Linnemannia schmuckeri TaxID=64567 RepID=A0A9P5S0F3_9FUNG|nr:Class II abasic (AP) endonuclease [Linnemannia schmuckeri]
MKFMTWNVNGIRTLIQYHPYCDDLHKNYKALPLLPLTFLQMNLEILDYLGADIICLQETKISRSKLDTDIALVPGYDSYWSFHRTKLGYSGVVIYVKDHIKLLGAEEGISGILSGYTPAPGLTVTTRSLEQDDLEDCSGDDDDEHLSGGSNGIGVRRRGQQQLSFEQRVAEAMTQFPDLDNEGRGLILDFGFFVLFNLYCPNETDDQRRPFKMAYYRLLEARVQDLIARGKEVIVMGDMNVVPTELDHCDPERWKKESGESEFGNTEPRRWFNAFLAPNGPLTDLYRVFHKDERGAFTCWNTKINARPSNYGTRLDYILVTEKLLPWFSSCDRQPHVVGSDHCPVIAEMAAELVLDKEEEQCGTQGPQESSRQQQNNPSKEKRLLQDILDSYGGTTDHPLAARFFDEFSGKQQKLSAFFKKPASSTGTPAAAKLTTTTAIGTIAFMDNKRPMGSQADEDDSSAPRKKPFLAAATTPTLPSTPPPPGAGSQIRTSTIDSIPKPIIKPTNKPGSSTATKKSATAAAKPSGQQTMLSFFGIPAKKPGKETTLSNDNLSQQQDKTSVYDAPQKPAPSPLPTAISASRESSIGSSQESLSLPTFTTAAPSSSSSSTTATSTFSPQDYADWIPGSQEVLPFSINGETTTSKWQTLFTPKTIPKCKFHNQPCTEYTVNKKGPNKGRRFFLCSL